jgi:lipopolysaccharide export system permease protein
MKIFFRYLLLRLLQTFVVVLLACTLLWVMVDLYGTLEDLLEHKGNFMLVVRFYLYQFPKMLVEVLPAAVLFSTVFTLLALNRRSELVALQAGGMAPLWMFSPFLLFGVIAMLVLAIDMAGPAATAEVTRERLLRQVKGDGGGANISTNLQYVDEVNHRSWFFSRLDSANGTADNIVITQEDAMGDDLAIYAGTHAHWTGDFWRMTDGVKKIIYNQDGSTDQRTYEELDLPDITTPPRQLALIVSQPEQLTTGQLAEYIETSTQSPYEVAKYQTQWWYRVLYPLSILVLMLFGLMQGARTDRRGAIAGVAWVIATFFLFLMTMYIFMAAGNHAKLSPFISVALPEFIFAALGLHLLAVKNGWWWQLHEYYLHWMEQRAAEAREDAEAEGETPAA